MKLEMERLQQHCEDQTADLQRANRRNVSVVPYREMKLSKFGGSEEFEQWEADAQASIMGGGMAQMMRRSSFSSVTLRVMPDGKLHAGDCI